MLFRPLLLLALSILAADALHSSTPPARKLTGAMAALRGSGASERLQQTPALRALRGGSDDTMAVNFVWLSCSSVALSSMLMVFAPAVVRDNFGMKLSDNDMRAYLAPAFIGWAVGKYAAASSGAEGAKRFCRAAVLPMVTMLAMMHYTDTWHPANTLSAIFFGIGYTYFGYF
ncbi:hypothetical protein T484DRAFT_1839615 [Baffinella frigidus]|nr:hypothetical protein T484DRAFT_1839615 [Cryptophyta sp. CCMP2293]